MSKKSDQEKLPHDTTIGWREMVALPEFGITSLRAKIDTGARTSALHAVKIKTFIEDGYEWAEFNTTNAGRKSASRCRAKIIDAREIKNTSGVPERRLIVAATLVLGKRHWRIEVSLADRENMGFDLILGRTAIRGRHIVVNPGRSFLAGKPEYTKPTK